MYVYLAVRKLYTLKLKEKNLKSYFSFAVNNMITIMTLKLQWTWCYNGEFLTQWSPSPLSVYVQMNRYRKLWRKYPKLYELKSQNFLKEWCLMMQSKYITWLSRWGSQMRSHYIFCRHSHYWKIRLRFLASICEWNFFHNTKHFNSEHISS